MVWLKKYWRVLLIVSITVVAPIIINWAILQPQKFQVVGDCTDWLTFCGGYLGSILTAGIALFVLWRQLKQNHSENEQNRFENEKANKANRELQLKVLEYQQQAQWLTSLRVVAIDYISIYNINELIEVQNLMLKDVNAAHNATKELLNRLSKSHLALLMMLTEQDCSRCNKENRPLCRFCFFINRQADNIGKLTKLVMDVQTLVYILMINKDSSATAQILNKLKTDLHTSDIMKEYINEVIETNSLIKEVNKLLDKRIMSMPEISFTQIDEQVRSFIGKEQERINNILIEN